MAGVPIRITEVKKALVINGYSEEANDAIAGEFTLETIRFFNSLLKLKICFTLNLL